jgi:hypothetical protein
LSAHAAYPAKLNDTAPSVGDKKASVKVKNGPLKMGAGTASAHADATSTSTSAVASNVTVVGGVSIGSIRTSTAQSVTKAGLHTEAVAEISNITIGVGHLLHIGSARSTLTIDSSPGKRPVDSASSKISGVTVLGKPATIDGKGVHVKAGPKLPKSVAQAYQKTLDTFFHAAGFGIKQASISRSDGHTGHTVSVAGLELFFKHPVTGTPPVTIGLPPGVPCPIAGITSQLPVDPCAGVGLSLNAKYRGQIALGQVGAVSLAQPGDKIPSVPNHPDGGGKHPGGGGHNGGGSGPSGGGGGLPPVDDPGSVGSGPTTVSTDPGDGAPPALAGNAGSVLDPLRGLSGRIWWFFPLIAISVLGLAGRLRTPARLPSQ